MTGVACVIAAVILFGVDTMHLDPMWQPIGIGLLLFIFWLIARRHLEYVDR